MKKIIVSVFLLIFLIAPQAHAQVTDRATLLIQIQQLLSLIESLQQQLEAKKVTSSTYMIPEATLPTEQVFGLETFAKATQPWSDNINVISVPKNSYKAHYFDTKQPSVVVKSEVVPKVAVSYAWSDGQGFDIASEDFGGYWVGDIDIHSDGNYEVSTAEGGSESKVIIDGRVVKTQSKENVTVFLEKGTYRVAVEYVNNWHTTGFAMNILPTIDKLSLEQAQAELEEFDGAENWYVGAYESGNFDKTISVDVSDMTNDSILFLGSYSQVAWNIQESSLLEAVVYASYEAGTTIAGLPDGVPVFKVGYNTLATEFSLEEECDTYRGSMFSACEEIDQLKKIDSSILGLTGSLTDTFSGEYSATSISAPEIVLSSWERSRILESYENAKTEAASETESQSIDNIF